jgi:hypothetical protein
MIYKQKIQNYSRRFAEYCGKNADYLPDAGLWVCYQDAGTVKKTTGEMMKDFESVNKDVLYK